MGFKEALKRLRGKSGLSQSELAEKAGVSVRTLQNWEIGRNAPRIEVLAKLAKGLGVDAAELLDLSADKPAKKRGK